jgi:hypothetical protein
MHSRQACSLTGKPGRRDPAAHRQASYLGGESPGEFPSLPNPCRFDLYLYLGYVLARVCESLARWSHGKVQSVATVCPYAITVVLRPTGT